MKYKTFRNLVMLGAAGLVGLGVWQIASCRAEQDQRERESAATEMSRRSFVGAHDAAPGLPRDLTRTPGESAAAPLAGGPVQGHASPEEFLLATLGQPATADKLKDVTDGAGSKINVYNEGGVWARAKIDHDRDEKWDEKWHRDGAAFVRQIAPNDDEQYTRELRKVDAAAPWAEPGAAPAEAQPAAEMQPAPEAEPAAGAQPAAGTAAPALATGREVDETMMGLLSTPVQEKIKDATKGRPYKINLYSDDRVRWNRAKVDLDRDDKFDEKWDFKDDGVVQRQVAPADDEQYSETYRLEGGRWVRQ